MKDYIILARVKNNRIYRRILDKYPSVNAFSIAHKLPQQKVGLLINLKLRAVDKNGNWTTLATDVSLALGCTEDDLFTSEQRIAQVKSNIALVELTRQQALQIANPMEKLENVELVRTIMRAANLTPNQSIVIEGIFFKDKTSEEIGRELDVGRKRICQIRDEALEKMRSRYVKKMIKLQPAKAGLHNEAAEVWQP